MPSKDHCPIRYDNIKTIFATIVKFLVAEGFVSLDVACTDGTKMEADANRYICSATVPSMSLPDRSSGSWAELLL